MGRERAGVSNGVQQPGSNTKPRPWNDRCHCHRHARFQEVQHGLLPWLPSPLLQRPHKLAGGQRRQTIGNPAYYVVRHAVHRS
jgi:hypothetical protein